SAASPSAWRSRASISSSRGTTSVANRSRGRAALCVGRHGVRRVVPRTSASGCSRRERRPDMAYPLLKFVHLLGLTLMGAGLIGVWYADLRSRQGRDLPLFAEAIRTIAVLYDGLVVPGALLLLVCGTWLIVTTYGGWAFLGMPWLAGG